MSVLQELDAESSTEESEKAINALASVKATVMMGLLLKNKKLR